MAGRQISVRKREEVPIAVIPTKVEMLKQQLVTLEKGLAQATGAIKSLQDFAGSIKIKKPDLKDARYRNYIDDRCDRINKAIENLPIANLPLVGHRFGDYVAWLKKTVEDARNAGRDGELAKLWTSLDMVKRQTDAIGRVMILQTDMLRLGIPQSIRIGDAPDPYGLVLDSLAAAVRTIGTKSEGIFKASVRAAEIYVANAQLYNTDSLPVKLERDSLLRFIVDKGDQARSGKEYSKKDAEEDERMLRGFERNVKSIAAQLKRHNVMVLAGWVAAIDTKLKETTELQMRQSLGSLKADVAKMLSKAQKGELLAQAEMSELSKRHYMLVEGRDAPMSASEWLSALEKQAQSLRGEGAVGKIGTPTWYGSRALALLRQDEPALANLALAMGMLESNAAGVSERGARDYLPSYWKMRDAVRHGRALTSGMMAGYSRQVELGSMLLEADRLAMDFSRIGSLARRKILMSVLPLIRSRMEKGDLAGAQRALGMARAYSAFMLQYGSKSWTAAKAMDDALMAERSGSKDAQAMFDNAVAAHAFAGEISRYRRAIADWSKTGMKEYLKTIESGLGKTDEFARNGQVQEGRRLLTLLVMYTDAVERLGVRGKRGVVYSVPKERGKSVQGMQRAVDSVVTGKPDVDGKGIEDTFMASFKLAQTACIENTIKSLTYEARTRPLGHATIVEAYAAVMRRAKAGDFRGAYSLLNMVEEFYGKWEPGRRQGWRYRMAHPAFPGHSAGVSFMLEGIKKEMASKSAQDSTAAAQIFDRGTLLIARTSQLQEAYTDWNTRYHGSEPFIKGKQETLGKIPMGEQGADGRYAAYLDLAKVRAYEKQNPDDRLLSGGKTLEQLLKDMESAANRGNVQGYLRAEKAFGRRLGLVSGRVARREAVDLWIARMERVDVALVKKQIGPYADKPAIKRSLDNFDGIVRRMSARLKALRTSGGAIPLNECMQIVTIYGSTLKRVRAYNFLAEQLTRQRDYAKKMGAGSGVRAGQAKAAMEQAEKALLKTIDLVLYAQNSPKSVAAAFGDYSRWRKVALAAYSAQGQSDIKAARWNYRLGYENIMDQFFKEILVGDFSKDSAARRQRMLHSLINVEVSVFGVPSPNVSQKLFANLSKLQYEILDNARYVAYKADFKWADQLIKEQGAMMKQLLKRSDDAAFWGNVATAGFALAVGLVNPFAGGALFATMAWDNVASQISVKGSASWESWAMLGVTIATMGFAGLANTFRFSAEALKSAGNVSRAAAFARAATVTEFALLGIGLGFMGYAGVQSYQAFNKGQMKEGIFLASMALFPAVVGGVAVVRGSRARKAALRQAENDFVLRSLERAQSEGAPIQVEITGKGRAKAWEPLTTREGLVAFLARFARADSAGMAKMMEGIPTNMRDAITSLAGRKDVQIGISKGTMPETADFAIMRALKSFEQGPTPPKGGGGKPIERETASWLSGQEGLGPLRQFLGDLMRPDGGTRAELNARAMARARLETLRAENPKTAEVIDGLVRNSAVRDAIQNNVWDNAFANRYIEKGRADLRSAMPKEVLAAENRATAVYQEQLLMAAGAEGQPIVLRTTKPGTPGTMQTRASAGGGKGPAEIAPGTVQPTAGGAPAGAGTRGSPAEPIVMRKERGPIREWIHNKVQSAQQKRADTKAAEEAARKATAELSSDLTKVIEPALRELVSNTIHPDQQAAYLAHLARSGELSAQEMQAIAGAVRMAPQRLADIVKAVWRRIHDRTTQISERTALWALLTKIYSNQNVRDAFRALAREGTNQALARIEPRVNEATLKAAGQQRMSVDTYRAALAKRGFREEMPLLVEMLEGQASQGRAKLQTRVTEAESNVHRLERQVAKAEAALAKAPSQRRQAAAVALRQKLLAAQTELAQLREQVAHPDNAPLAYTQRLLGIELTPAQRVAALKKLMDSGLVSGGDVIFEVQNAFMVAANRLQNMDVANKPVAKAMRGELERSLNTENMAMGLDDSLALALRSEEVVNAITKGQPARAKGLYLAAVKEGSLNEILAKLKDVLGDAQMKQITEFVERARQQLGGQYTTLNGLAEKYTNAVGEGDLLISAVGTQTVPVMYRMMAFWERAWASNWLKVPLLRWWSVDGRYYSMSTQYFLRKGLKVLRETPRSAWWDRGYGATKQFVLQAAFWAATGYAAYRLFKWMFIAEPEKVVDRCKRDYGIACTVEQVRYIQQKPAFFSYLSRKLLVGSERRPGSPEALKRALESDQWHLNIPRLGEIIDIGKEMDSRLSEVNALIKSYRTGSADEKAEARGKLSALLGRWGITIEAMEKKLAEKARYDLPQKLEITDMVDLSRGHFRGKGLMVNTKDVIIEQFLTDAGIPFKRGQGVAKFLVENTDMYIGMWELVQKGNLPRTYIRDALTAISAQDAAQSIRKEAEQRKVKLADAIATALTAKGLYIETAVPQGSFMDRLDAGAVREPDQKARAAMQNLLKGYLANKEAVAKLNSFIIKNDEEVYGDRAALAKWILAYTGKDAVAEARKLGYVGPVSLVGIRRFSSALQTEIVKLVNERSNERNQGIMAWVKANYTDITDLASILQHLVAQGAAQGWTAADYYDGNSRKGQLVAMEPVFIQKDKGWLRRPSKFERQRLKRLVSPKKNAAIFEGLDREGQIRMLKSMTAKDRAMMMRAFTPKQRQLYEQLPQDVRIISGAGLSAVTPRIAPGRGVKSGPAIHKLQEAKALIKPEMEAFYKSADGKELERYLKAMMSSIWKQEKERIPILTIYHRAMGGIGELTPEMIKEYSHQWRVPQVLDYMNALVKSEAYLTLSGKKVSGAQMLRSAGFSGKMEGGILKITIGDPSPKSLHAYIKTYVITPTWKGG